MLFETQLLTVINRPADGAHHTKGRGGLKPECIILHHTGGVDSLAWLSTTSSPPVSCHRLISKAGTIYKIVDDDDTAYCAGYGLIGPVDPDASDPPGIARNLNQISLNIELENLGNGSDPYPAAQLQSCALQIMEWVGLYGWLPILYHKQVDANKQDPRGLDRPDLDRRILALLPGGRMDMPLEIESGLRAAVAAGRTVISELGAVLAWRAGI